MRHKIILIPKRLSLCVPIALLCMASLCRVSRAERLDQIPNPRQSHGWISDTANVLDATTRRRLDALIDQLENKTTAEIAVVTIQRTDGRTPKEFATSLFNYWRIGKRGRNNGVLVLLVLAERRIEVETGYGMASVLPGWKVQAILQADVVPRFKQGDYGGGVLGGVRTMAQTIAQAAPTKPRKTSPRKTSPPRHRTAPRKPIRIAAAPARAKPSPVPATSNLPFGSGSPYSSSPSSPLLPVFVVLLLGLGGAGAVAAIVAVTRHLGTRRCPQCQQEMRRLTEQQDDAYLNFGQKLEEDLGSVDYRVWRCDDCRTLHIERASKWFSGYEDCPQCQHRTVLVRSHTIREPSYTWEGLEEVERSCRFPQCNYRDVRQRTIPRRTPPPSTTTHHHHHHSSSHSSSFSSSPSSSGSSGGSFGGGSSGGGGAGASW